MLTPQQIADKWMERAQAAGKAMAAGVDALTESDSPMRKAAAAEGRWAEGVARAAQNGSFRKGLEDVSLSEWKEAYKTKGIPNYQNGLKGGKSKMVAYQQFAQPIIRNAVASLPERGTLAANKQRCLDMIDAMVQMGEQRRAG